MKIRVRKKNYKLKIIIHENSWTFMDIRVKIKHTQRKKLLILPISFWPRQMSVFSLFTFHYSLNIIRVLKKHPDGFLLSTKCVFFPKRSVGLFIEFCPHEVPSLLPCRMEANSFAYSRHGSSDVGQSPRQNVFYLIFF